jgi:hypothetical protein
VVDQCHASIILDGGVTNKVWAVGGMVSKFLVNYLFYTFYLKGFYEGLFKILILLAEQISLKWILIKLLITNRHILKHFKDSCVYLLKLVSDHEQRNVAMPLCSPHEHNFSDDHKGSIHRTTCVVNNLNT